MAPADPDADDLQTVELTAAPRHASDELPASTSAAHSPTNGRTYTPSSSTPGTRPRASPRNRLDGETTSNAGSAAAARDVEGGFSGRVADGPADPDDDVGLLGGGTVRRKLLTAPKLPRWVGPAGTAGALLLLLIMSAVALRHSSAAQSASAAAFLLSQALITDRLNRVSASLCRSVRVAAQAQHELWPDYNQERKQRKLRARYERYDPCLDGSNSRPSADEQ